MFLELVLIFVKKVFDKIVVYKKLFISFVLGWMIVKLVENM